MKPNQIRDLGLILFFGGIYGFCLWKFWPAPEVIIPGLGFVPFLWWAIFKTLLNNGKSIFEEV